MSEGTSDRDRAGGSGQSDAGPEDRNSNRSPDGASVRPEAPVVTSMPPQQPPQPSMRPSDAAASADIEQVRGALLAVTEERGKMKDQLLRTAADFDNYRKRSRKDVEDAQRRGKEETVRELLPIADNLERALAAGSVADTSAVLEGVRMVLKLFHDTLERIGVTRVESVGSRFDPMHHEALKQEERNDVAPGTIVAELVPGYLLGDKLIRAAMVAVARPPAGVSVAPPRTTDPSSSDDTVIEPGNSKAPGGAAS